MSVPSWGFALGIRGTPLCNGRFKQWSTVFPGAACVGALVDRFSHQCHPVDIDADSWRKKESQTVHKKARAKEHEQTKKPRG